MARKQKTAPVTLGEAVDAELDKLAAEGKLPEPPAALLEPKAEYTDEEQAAYFGANLSADIENRKPDADIHAWYRRTGGLKKES